MPPPSLPARLPVTVTRLRVSRPPVWRPPPPRSPVLPPVMVSRVRVTVTRSLTNSTPAAPLPSSTVGAWRLVLPKTLRFLSIEKLPRQRPNTFRRSPSWAAAIARVRAAPVEVANQVSRVGFLTRQAGGAAPAAGASPATMATASATAQHDVSQPTPYP